MRERPILFSAPMVLAILEGRKTMTRRALNERDLAVFAAAADLGECGRFLEGESITPGDRKNHSMLCRYGDPGDRLWVRETFQPILADGVDPGAANYKTGSGWRASYPATDGRIEFYDLNEEGLSDRCKPAIHMPRWASRTLLEITSTRVERLQEITEEDAAAEGVELAHPGTPSSWYKDYAASKAADALQDPYHGLMPSAYDSFASLWASINGIDSWDANPWVWVVEFRRVAP